MGEFVKPKRVIVSDKEYIQKLVNANLVKDLHDNEKNLPLLSWHWYGDKR